ncbi:uncharacterized protein LOC119295783 isoform X2 [Triticum dicoccoides]|uniref:uncharacterized protein LOC119295783 isoform X2 n=1 Tax=Triticum dicoccoides TaxID=85692 RepID=UPI00188E8655|nr:uncharacterized protein LOC119295783 isoform X2 [Triticum dicoccoides]
MSMSWNMYILSSSLMWLPLQHTSLQGPRVGMIFYKDGRTETVHFDKITVQLKKLSYGHFDKSTATPCSSRRRSALGYTWVSPPASSTSSSPRPLPRSPPPSLTMPPSRRGLLCPTYRQVEIVCVALVNKEHSCRKVQERIGKLVSFSLVSEK